MTGLQVRGLGDRDPPVLAADTPSQLTPILWHLVHFNVPLFYVSRCVFEALSWDKGFCCVSSIKRHFFLSSPPLEILLGQAVPAQDLFIAGFVLPLPCAHTPPPALPARGVFPPQPMKSGWQHLPRCCNPGHHLPWQPWGAAAPFRGSFPVPLTGHTSPGASPALLEQRVGETLGRRQLLLGILTLRHRGSPGPSSDLGASVLCCKEAVEPHAEEERPALLVAPDAHVIISAGLC